MNSTSSKNSPATAVVIHGAREHNLKNISLAIPRGKFVVVTGVSGSGKSTLAFDLLFAEGQRRFLDSMNLYARQFVEQLARPDVDLIEGIPPTVSIEQRDRGGGGKSTVATVTEIYQFLRLLFARLGTQHCPDCGVPVQAQTRDEVGRQLQAELKRRGELVLLAPVVKGRKGFHTDVAEWAARHGFEQVRADGILRPTNQPLRLDRFREHHVEIVIGAVAASRQSAAKSAASKRRRSAGPSLQQLVDETLRVGHGTLLALDPDGKTTVHSTERACPKCNRSFEPLDPKNFSYNSAAGWCPKCRGFGELFYLPDVERGANADAVEESWWSWASEREVCPECLGARINPVARAVRLKVGPASRRPLPGMSHGESGQRDAGPAITDFSALSVEAGFDFFRQIRFKGRAALVARDILPEICERLKFLNEVGLGYLQLGRGMPTLSGGEGQRIRLAAQLGSNLSGVLYILDEPTIGLHARDNERLLDALEKLRARGNSVLCVEHDEATMRRADWVIDLGPGAGVHGGEVVAAGTLAELAKHPESVTGQCLREQAARKYPARGERRPVEMTNDEWRMTKEARSPKPEKATRNQANRASDFGIDSSFAIRHSSFPWLTLHHAAKNNLRDLTVRFPLGRFTCVTGVSGSGKSTLIRECLLPALKSRITQHTSRSGHEDEGRGRAGAAGIRHPASGIEPSISGHESLAAVHEVDQSPIGRTPRSTPATYVGFFDEIRALFAQVPEARLRGYGPGRFSFNSPAGRCTGCDGAGQVKLEMNFLPPAFVRCETCNGLRFVPETLDIQYGGKNIAEVLDLSVEEALEFFQPHRKIHRALQALHDTGLHYVKLGQTSPTLSGGEAQRVKLVTHLLGGLKPAPETEALPALRQDTDSRLTPHASRPEHEDDGRGRARLAAAKRSLFLLEEPTIGLHIADVRRLVEVLQRLVDAGHTVIVIEHNLDLIAEADWVIDLGPEGGAGGGRIMAEGTPVQIAQVKGSHTGRWLPRMV
jgi:excinuclease ABC subunit A